MSIVLIFILQLLLFAVAKTNSTGAESSVVGIVFVVLNVGLLLAQIIRTKENKLIAWLILGLAAREFLLFANIYDWFPVPHSGADTEAFNITAEMNFRAGGYYYWHTNYTNIISTIYFIVGPVRMIAQQFNVVLGMGVIFVCLKIFDELNFSTKQKQIATAMLALFPHICIFSAILLREAPIQFCLAYSTLFFIRWMKNKPLWNLVISLVFILGAASLHGGSVFWACGYVAAVCVYRPAFRKNALTVATIGGIVLAGLAVVAMIPLMDKRVDAMATALSEGEVAVDGEKAADAAGSAYLTWLNISNPYLLLLFSPLKMFYFLFSPLPPDWRGAMDVIAFVFDSTIYAGAFWTIWRGLKHLADPVQKNIVRYLLVSVLAMSFVFGYGTIASGTALRHRCKFFPELLVCAIACRSRKRNMRNGTCADRERSPIAASALKSGFLRQREMHGLRHPARADVASDAGNRI